MFAEREAVLAEDRPQRVLASEHYWPGFSEETFVGGAYVIIFDVTRSMSQRVEGQYRRNWSFIPGLWNLYFRDEINRGVSLKTAPRVAASGPCLPEEQDAAVAAAKLYEKLETGVYVDQRGKRRKLDGDTSKLMYAEGVTPLQKRLLADFRFRTRLVAGTQEVRTKIGHIGFWASV